MSDDFGKSVKAPHVEPPTDKEIAQMYPDHVGFANASYNRLLNDYFLCVSTYLEDFYDPMLLEQQLGRRDLDTVCAYELY